MTEVLAPEVYIELTGQPGKRRCAVSDGKIETLFTNSLPSLVSFIPRLALYHDYKPRGKCDRTETMIRCRILVVYPDLVIITIRYYIVSLSKQHFCQHGTSPKN